MRPSFTLLRAVRRAALVIALAAWAALSGPVAARPANGTCFSVTDMTASDVPPSSWRCAGAPNGYRERALWLRLPMPSDRDGAGPAVVVHSTRFDRLTAVFVHRGGAMEVQRVRRGDYGAHWRIGGQLSFRPDARPVEAIWLRIDRLQNYGLLRVRLVPIQALARQFEMVAALIGAALSLLLFAAVYNVGLATVIRRRMFLWQGLWAVTMVAWGLVWSQAALLVAPDIAGTTAGRLSTILSCLAVLFAAFGALDALTDVFAAVIRRAILFAAIGVVALGGLAGLPGADLDLIGAGLSVLVLFVLGGVALGLTIGARRGDRQVRDLLIAWAGPMLALAATQIFDFSTSLFGGGAQIAVLFASAFQTLCFASLATYRLGGLRVERDAAVASEALLVEMAERDVLTGLLNRRGFIRRCDQMFGGQAEAPFALLLIDVDRFKSVNDRFGHEVGDAVLVSLGARLARFDRGHDCLVGRLGGEEFVLGVRGLSDLALEAFAEEVRSMLGAAPDAVGRDEVAITVSIGVAEGQGSGPFHRLYGKADRALYRAKAMGRDRVVLWSPCLVDTPAGLAEPRYAPI